MEARMRAILVSPALVMILSAGTAYADPIHLAGHSAPSGAIGAISDLSVRGGPISLDLTLSSSSPAYLMAGLDARQNYPDSNWIDQLGAPASFSSWIDDDGSSVTHGSRLERSFLAAGGRAFGAYRSSRSMPGSFRWSGHDKHNHKHKHGRKQGHNSNNNDNNDDNDDNANDDSDGSDPFPGVGPGGDPIASPEPGALLLVGSGLIALARHVRKRRGARVRP
jgi:hypothetical protein